MAILTNAARVMLRPAALDDIPFLVELERTFAELGYVNSDGALVHQREMANSDCRYYIVIENGRSAGYVILRGLMSLNHCLELKRIVVARPGHGLGRQVLSVVIDKVFREFSAHRLWLDVRDNNHRARHVYRLVGFIEEGTLGECIDGGERRQSLVVMSILECEYRRLRSAC